MLHSYLPKLILTSLFIPTVCSSITKLCLGFAVRAEARRTYRRRSARPSVEYSRIGTDQSTMLKISYLELMNM